MVGSPPFREKLLITHRGLSGPAILQISSYWRAPAAIAIDLAPGQDITAPFRERNAQRDTAAAKTAFRQVLPNRLADRWVDCIRLPIGRTVASPNWNREPTDGRLFRRDGRL